MGGGGMDSAMVLDLGVKTLLVAAKLSAPILITALAVGFAIALLQSMTQIQEVTLSFVPKLLGIAIVLVVCGNWMIQTLVQFTQQLFDELPKLLGG
ncbi:flagellar biosynthesis protein FliQ [Gryllotalpicola kribbensis]|jgi:flagellar biosynthetic protein FliQ|uniref:Flagellar biosynthetic protein FliQ n=2 Tax=Gryllotalpicola kribbensis TaxID=993084 RepID=A0ABP8ALI4_9MICO